MSKTHIDTTQWVDEHGDYLYRYALSRLRDPSSAEDVVQETLVAALRAIDQYSGRGSERGWLLGILKRKVVDHVRKRASLREERASEDNIDNAVFRADGHWHGDPRVFRGAPDEELERQEFWQTLDSCLEALTPRQRDVFLLRELEGMSTEGICSALEISSTNLWVLLHRARLRLAGCLSAHWRETA